jgi:hypothetical protein
MAVRDQAKQKSRCGLHGFPGIRSPYAARSPMLKKICNDFLRVLRCHQNFAQHKPLLGLGQLKHFEIALDERSAFGR